MLYLSGMQEANRITRILLVDDDRDDCFLFQEALDRVAPQTELTCLDDADELWETMKNRMCISVKASHPFR